MQVVKKLEKLIADAFEKTGVDTPKEIHLERPADPSHGDYSTNTAMVAYRDASGDVDWKSPRELAQAITDNLDLQIADDDIVEKVEVAGPGFINFYLSKTYYANQLSTILADQDNYGKSADITPKKISLEHTQVNPNKEPHVGHLRNAVIGDSITRILRFLGHDVKVQYYQNDAGLQVASIVLAYQKKYHTPDDFGSFVEWASVAYVDIEKRILEDEELAGERDKVQLEIAKQEGDIADLAREVTDKILFEVIEIFNDLGVYYNLVVRESDIVKNSLWDKTFDLLKNSDKFYLADSGDKKGCWLVVMPDEDDKVIVRSNGVPTYTGNDIAYHLWKFGVLDDFGYSTLGLRQNGRDLYVTSTDTDAKEMEGFSNADAIVNIIDTTQTYPQETVRQAMKILGYQKFADNYHHVNYGFVYLSPKSASKIGIKVEAEEKKLKISGRKGTVLSVRGFVEMLKDKLVEEYGDFQSADQVAKGAVKFEMLKYDTYQDVVFDIDTALDQKGFSAPYIQYTFARTKGVLKKAKIDELGTDIGVLPELNPGELLLLQQLVKFPEVVRRAAEKFAPHHICSYLFGLAQSYNTFYNSQQIIGSDKQEFRLILTNSTNIVLKNGLELLGIDAPESM